MGGRASGLSRRSKNEAKNEANAKQNEAKHEAKRSNTHSKPAKEEAIQPDRSTVDSKRTDQDLDHDHPPDPDPDLGELRCFNDGGAGLQGPPPGTVVRSGPGESGPGELGRSNGSEFVPADEAKAIAKDWIYRQGDQKRGRGVPGWREPGEDDDE